MQQTSIPAKRKHVYFYVLLALATLCMVIYRPMAANKANDRTRATEVNRLANALFK